MLRELKINQLAVIDQASLELGEGFICLTGESGAGKSVIIDALLLLAGRRASSDLVRTGCDKAVVEAIFDIDPAQAVDLDLLDGPELFLRREISAEGKSRSFVNGVAVPNAVLQSYAEPAFEIYGQHGQQKLMNDKFHLDIFQEQTGLTEAAATYKKKLKTFRNAWQNYWELRDGEAQRLKELDFVRMQLKEINEVKPSEEDEDLDLRLKKARNAEEIKASRFSLVSLLDDSLLPDIKKAGRILSDLLEFEPGLQPYAEQIEGVSAVLSDLHGEVDIFEDDDDPGLLDRLEERESALNRLYMKYGRDLQEVIAERDKLLAEERRLRGQSEGLDDVWKTLSADYLQLKAERDKLCRARAEAAAGFSEEVSRQLQDLSLKGAAFLTDHQWPEWPGSLPQDRDFMPPTAEFRFLFSANTGEPAKPLGKVASGGELSRVLLALINAFPRRGSKLLVFDEIDAGLGGETAQSVGVKLAELGKRHQVFCVTHFAQVARFADHQIKVEKNVTDGRTKTSLVICDLEQRVAELARLMAGDAGAEGLRDHARRLLTKV